ncbi:UNKNOWN [Stylonychia lemnae]|uniref:Uncharacterized protein n=1 Tax=Stylonychia lemnae TaxID=5949 RepID=A0A078ADJ1_STYLE|nr:UNKNOWN [Stylonychia lemnae]|eukprot:CDW78938.1 UNKNOWN [Stylonychia lemnae]
MKSRFAHLKIDAYQSRHRMRKDSSKFSSCLTLIQSDMSDQEIRIHQYLDQLNIYQQEIKEALHDQSLGSFDSPKLAHEFHKRYTINRRSYAQSGHKSSFHEKIEKIGYESCEEGGSLSEQPNTPDLLAIDMNDHPQSEYKFKRGAKKSQFYLNQDDIQDENDNNQTQAE